MDYQGKQEVTGGYKLSQGLQGVTTGYKGLKGVTGSYNRELPGGTGGYKL